MSDLYDDGPPEEPTTEKLCRRAFSRCKNWPTEPDGITGLAEGLKAASERYRISEEDLIARCRELTPFCPTDHTWMAVASDLFKSREAAELAERSQHAEWERQYGKANAVDMGLEGKCECGRDWEEIVKTAENRRRKLSDALRKHFTAKHGKWPPYHVLAPVARQLGFEKEAKAWERA